MKEELSEKWEKFSLLEDEDTRVCLESSQLTPLVNRGKDCLIGKLVANRIIPKDFFRGPLLRAWKPEGMVSLWMIGDNLFLAELEFAWEKT
jgi:hypothetical protein